MPINLISISVFNEKTSIIFDFKTTELNVCLKAERLLICNYGLLQFQIVRREILYIILSTWNLVDCNSKCSLYLWRQGWIYIYAIIAISMNFENFVCPFFQTTPWSNFYWISSLFTIAVQMEQIYQMVLKDWDEFKILSLKMNILVHTFIFYNLKLYFKLMRYQ